MDEIGLAELNPSLPLKTLHSLIDEGGVSFIGVSNWILDSSKMNRAIRIFRPFPSDNDIHQLITQLYHGSDKNRDLIKNCALVSITILFNFKGSNDYP